MPGGRHRTAESPAAMDDERQSGRYHRSALAAPGSARPVSDAALLPARPLGSRPGRRCRAREGCRPLHRDAHGAGSRLSVHVVERGAWVDVLRRRTDWFEVRTANGKEGWVYIDQMEQTLQPSGAPTRFERADQAQFANRSWEMGRDGAIWPGPTPSRSMAGTPSTATSPRN